MLNLRHENSEAINLTKFFDAISNKDREIDILIR